MLRRSNSRRSNQPEQPFGPLHHMGGVREQAELRFVFGSKSSLLPDGSTRVNSARPYVGAAPVQGVSLQRIKVQKTSLFRWPPGGKLSSKTLAGRLRRFTGG